MPQPCPDSFRRSAREPDRPDLTAGTAPRRVLFVLDDLGGGTGNHILSMLRYWDRSRWEPAILSRRPVGTRVKPESVEIAVLPSYRRWEIFPLGHIRRFFLVRRHLRRHPADIVHAYFFWSIIYGRLLKLSGTISHLVENREDLGFNWGWFEYLCLRLTRRVPDRVICVCDAVRNVVLERERIDQEKPIVIRNGIEPGGEPHRETALRNELGIPESVPLVGMVANFNRKVKGVADFLDAIPLILQKIPDAYFLLVGRGPEEPALRAQAARLGIDRRLVFAGFREDIDRCYQAMDVSVLTSYSEGLSITILESMRAGLPVVVTRVGGNPEIVEDGATGFLVPPKDPRAFADNVIRILRDPELRQRMGSAARHHVMAGFGLATVANRYLDVYAQILG